MTPSEGRTAPGPVQYKSLDLTRIGEELRAQIPNQQAYEAELTEAAKVTQEMLRYEVTI